MIASLIASPAHAATTYSYAFPFNGTTGALQNAYYAPVYSLGTLALNYSITISFNLPNKASPAQLIAFINYFKTGANNLALRYLDLTVATPAMVAANTITYPAITGTPTTYSFTYQISFPNSYKLTSAPFYLFVKYPTALTNNLFDYYTITATYFLTSQLISVGSGSISTLLKVV